MKKTLIGLSLLLGSGVFSASAVGKIAPTPYHAPPTLSALRWQLVSIHEAKLLPSPESASGVALNQYQLDFKGGSFNLGGPCNSHFGPVQFSGKNNITVGLVAGTKKGCPEPLMAADSEVTQLLGAVTTYQLKATQLFLSDGNRVLTFKGTPTDESKSVAAPKTLFVGLRNTTKGMLWRLETYDNNGIHTNPKAAWRKSGFPGIRDFAPEKNREYTVRVKAFKDKKTGKEQWVKDMIVMEGVL